MKLRPSDCKDQYDAARLNDQGIKINEDSIEICPNYVILTIGDCTIKIGMGKFKTFAEWYLTDQEIDKPYEPQP